MGDIWKVMIPILNPLNDGVLTVSLMILLVLEMFRKRTGKLVSKSLGMGLHSLLVYTGHDACF